MLPGAHPDRSSAQLVKSYSATLSEDDEVHYNQALDRLYSQQRDIGEIIINQTHIVRSEFDNFNSQIQNVSAQVQALVQKSTTIIETLQKTQYAIRRTRLEKISYGTGCSYWTQQLMNSVLIL